MSKEKAQEQESKDIFQSYHLSEKTTEAPLIRVMALHALAYCERLFYLEEVEEIRRADANVFTGRRMHEQLNKGPDVYSLELASEDLGIRGKMDCTQRKSGKLVVYEHKKGRSQKGAEPWPSDRLQVVAYALLLSEYTGEPVEEARIRYHADNKTVKIPINRDDAEKELEAAVLKAREIRSSLERPAVTAHEKLCRSCSLAPVCLPEEERFARLEKVKLQRLFPPDDDRRVVHVVEQGCSIRKDGDQIVVHFPDGNKKQLPGMAVLSLVLHGNVQISTQVVHFCAAHDIGVHWLSYGGYYVGGLSAGAGAVQRKNRQYKAFQDSQLKSRLVVRLALCKVENQIRYILRATRGNEGNGRDKTIDERIVGIRGEIQALGALKADLDAFDEQEEFSESREKEFANEVRGHEGNASRIYFSILPFILNLKEDHFLYFSGRNRRPPKDPVNALLSFGYSLLYKDCVAALLSVGLDPSFGFFHTPRSAAYPLAMDLMELFRIILWDIPVIGSINRKQWKKEDFDISGKQVWLNTEGRRKAISIYENRKQEKWKHPVLNYSLSYSRTIELEARLLEKEWTAAPGVFAQLRLR